ncbi:MAG: pentapeptide repeat-containing protein [Deltaproteobacteria bacterium]|nr:MAG: pentapeptide repeat-containing protein [Deltaproteobacteria bacterium]
MADNRELQRLLSDEQQILGADLSQAQLRGENLRGKVLIHSDFTLADLSGSVLSQADLSQANFEGANLSSCDLKESDFTFTNLKEADLSEASLAHALLYDTNLRGSNLQNADCRHAVLSGVDLAEANLSGADFSKAELCGVDLRKVDLRGVNMTQADLSDTDLRGVDLRETELSDVVLVSAKYDKQTRWPESINPDDAGVRLISWETRKANFLFFLKVSFYWTRYSIAAVLLVLFFHFLWPSLGFYSFGFLLCACVFSIYIQMPKSSRHLQSELRRTSGQYNKKVGQSVTLGLLLNLVVLSVVMFALFTAGISFRWGGFHVQEPTFLTWLFFSIINILDPISLGVPEKLGLYTSPIRPTHFLSRAYVLAYQLFIDFVLVFTFVRYWKARTEEARILRKKTILTNKQR